MSMNPLRRRSTEAPTARDDVTAAATERDVDRTVIDDRRSPVADDDLFRDRTADRSTLDRPLPRDADVRDPDARDPDLRDPDLRDPDLRDRHDHDRHDHDGHDLGEQPAPLDRAAVVAREKEAFGGLKLGSAFFGWLTALGTAVLLTALVAAATTAVRVASGEEATADPATIAAGTGLRTDVAIIVILFVAYYCGGYVAGRMARFNGAKQGLAVWVIAIVAALLITAVGAVAGAQWDLLGTLNGFPRLEDTAASTVTSSGVVTTLIALAAALVGAALGGLAGMRFHRRVDRAGLGR
jgi:hypothetical protein